MSPVDVEQWVVNGYDIVLSYLDIFNCNCCCALLYFVPLGCYGRTISLYYNDIVRVIQFSLSLGFNTLRCSGSNVKIVFWCVTEHFNTYPFHVSWFV